MAYRGDVGEALRGPWPRRDERGFVVASRPSEAEFFGMHLIIAPLGPSLALSALALALASWTGIERASIGVGIVWLIPPMMLRLPLHRLLELFGTPAQLLSMLILVTAAGIVTTRRYHFDLWEV